MDVRPVHGAYALYQPTTALTYRSAAARPGPRTATFLNGAPEAHPTLRPGDRRLAIDVWSALGRPATFSPFASTAPVPGAGGRRWARGVRRRRPDLARRPPLLPSARWRSSRVGSRSCRRASGRGRSGTTGAPIGRARDRERGASTRCRPHRVRPARATGNRRGLRGDHRRGPPRRCRPDRPSTARRSRRASSPRASVLIPPRGRPAGGGSASRTDGMGRAARRAASPRGNALLIRLPGHPAAALSDNRRRPAGTLAAYLSHRSTTDRFRAIGRQDLTAHVRCHGRGHGGG
jgi:hypothetical protein